MSLGGKEFEMMLPPELRDPEVVHGGERRASTPRIIGPHAAFSLTYKISEGVTPDPEALREFERELDVRARFMVPGMRAFLEEILTQEPVSAVIIPFPPRE